MRNLVLQFKILYLERKFLYLSTLNDYKEKIVTGFLIFFKCHCENILGALN